MNRRETHPGTRFAIAARITAFPEAALQERPIADRGSATRSSFANARHSPNVLGLRCESHALRLIEPRFNIPTRVNSLPEAAQAPGRDAFHRVPQDKWDDVKVVPTHRVRAVQRRRAFSLVELLVTMALLSFIVLGLMAVFNQTQRAFKLGMSQVDVLEGGRAAMDLMAGEVEEMTAMGNQTVNFVAEVPKYMNGDPIHVDLLQDLVGTTHQRTNILQEFFFVSRVNQEWVGTGYFVDATNGIGSLYRFSTRVPVRHLSETNRLYGDLYSIYRDNRDSDLASFSRVIDGVIHLRIGAYGTNGFLLEPYYDLGVYTNITVDYDSSAISTYYAFRSNALPTAVEIELAVVEPDVWQRVAALPAAGTVREGYLREQAGKVHVFKRRVPIRRADPEAYK